MKKKKADAAKPQAFDPRLMLLAAIAFIAIIGIAAMTAVLLSESSNTHGLAAEGPGPVGESPQGGQQGENLVGNAGVIER